MHDLAILADAIASGESHATIVARLRPILEGLQREPSNAPVAWHPLGFLHTKLGAPEAGAALRFHIWPSGKRSVQEPDWPVHDHVFALTSHVLVGAVTNHFFDVAADGKASHRIYTVRYDGTASILQQSDFLVDCRLEETRSIAAGATYAISKGQFHSTEVSNNDFAATIVLSSAIEAAPPQVVGDVQGANAYRYERVACDPEYFASQVSKVLEALSAA